MRITQRPPLPIPPEPISNLDRLVLVLRQRLQERARTSARGKRESRSGQREGRGAANPLETVQALASVDDVDDRQLKRALIQSLLSESLGRDLVNQAGFQQMVDRVTTTLESDPELGPLMARVVTDLRTAARP